MNITSLNTLQTKKTSFIDAITGLLVRLTITSAQEYSWQSIFSRSMQRVKASIFEMQKFFFYKAYLQKCCKKDDAAD